MTNDNSGRLGRGPAAQPLGPRQLLLRDAVIERVAEEAATAHEIQSLARLRGCGCIGVQHWRQYYVRKWVNHACVHTSETVGHCRKGILTMVWS
jgi:hypothetical protein